MRTVQGSDSEYRASSSLERTQGRDEQDDIRRTETGGRLLRGLTTDAFSTICNKCFIIGWSLNYLSGRRPQGGPLNLAGCGHLVLGGDIAPA